MKFLIDQQLPPALAKFIQARGHTSKHVREIGLRDADDRTIWRHAAENDMVIVSKDEDFYFLATASGNAIKFLWVRIGNCRTKALLEKLDSQFPQALAAFESGSIIVEVR